MTPDNALQTIEGEVLNVVELQRDFEQKLAALKTAQQKLDDTWKSVEEQMIVHDIKSLKGDWGSITIAERLGWDIDLEQLPSKFIKKVADTKKISDTYRLEGKAPKGCEPKTSKYLTKRIK